MASETEQDVQQNLAGADYPATNNELVSAAQNNDAPQGSVSFRPVEDTNPSRRDRKLNEFLDPQEINREGLAALGAAGRRGGVGRFMKGRWPEVTEED